MSDQTTAEQQPEQQKYKDNPWAGFNNPPPPSLVEQLKLTWGEVFLSSFTPDEWYIFRALSRGEHRELQTELATGKIDQLQYEERIVEKCLLAPDLGPHKIILQIGRASCRERV